MRFPDCHGPARFGIEPLDPLAPQVTASVSRQGDIPPQADVSAALLRLAQKRLLARTVVDGRELYFMTRAIMNELSAWKRQQELLPLALALAAT